MNINVNFDFTTDTPKFWDEFWDDEVLGGFGNDPDSMSKTLQLYHKILWSRQLPNGEIMNLKIGRGSNYLTWKSFRFGSDSILASFRYSRYRNQLEKVSNNVSNYREFIENFLHKSYTIGGTIIFPKENSLNGARGMNPFIKDRWDLTLECIRRYYQNEESPLFETLKKNKEFFDLFVDFKGYIEYFFLQDCVSDDFEKVNIWLGDGTFVKNPLPNTVEDYLLWIDKQMEFLEKRNNRIECFLSEE